MKLFLQEIVEGINKSEIPSVWFEVDLQKFSDKKSLFDYQEEALQNAIKALYLYYQRCQGDKAKFYELYQRAGLTDDLGYNVKKESKIVKYLLEYDEHYPVVDGKIPFERFINRMSFWMATGSGKTLVIVKLIEVLYHLMKNNLIPQKDILFLTYREDLIQQFKRHVEEFNQFQQFNGVSIDLISLKEYESKKNNPEIKFRESINVFYYRSDLISDEQKDKIVNYKNYDNGGNWYIILDEAHKGDKETSKRQIFYSILSRNGFMFNFSATFTDPRDYITCVYNFNLAEFVKSGYGKSIYISKESIEALGDKNGESYYDKQKILFKIFILQTALNKLYERLRTVDPKLYHKPLLLTLVNSVNTEDSDLELFFKEVARIASGKAEFDLIEDAKEELIEELSSAEYEFEGEAQLGQSFLEEIDKSSFEDILRYVFNSDTAGDIEVLKIPSNKQELVFKLKTSSRPFALMKIGDISDWLKEKLSGYEIIERFEEESLFANINNNEDINILMGSRSFYEGWDSNRPNIILFINIGKGVEAKKFVLQSIGRGVRIEPIPNERRRAKFLEIDHEIYNKIRDLVKPIETLYVFGTKADNLNKVIEMLAEENIQEDFVSIGDEFEINSEASDKPLLIPVFTESNRTLINQENIIKYPIHSRDLEMLKNYLSHLDDRIICCKFNCSVKTLKEIKEILNDNAYFEINDEESLIMNHEILIRKIIMHFETKVEEFKEFKKLEDEIVHFKRIEVKKDKLDGLKNIIREIKNIKERERELERKIRAGEIDFNTLKREMSKLERLTEYDGIKLKNIEKHYYTPLLLTEDERIDFIKHIIKTESEAKFIEELEEALEKQTFEEFEWWYFSKIDETLDKIYIPYYDPLNNRIGRFKPDFIFWFKLKGKNDYCIVFVDPKGIAHANYTYKIDGFSRVFEETKDNGKKSKKFVYGDLNIYVKLFIKPKQGECSKRYKPYCIKHAEDLFKSLRSGCLND